MSDYGGAGAQRQRQSSQRLDGIQKLSGNVTFAAGGVTLNVSVPSDGGSLTNTSDFGATGVVGASVPNPPVYLPASMDTATKTLTSSLPAGDAGKQYTVQVGYKLDGKQATALTGSVIAKATGPAAITLQ